MTSKTFYFTIDVDYHPGSQTGLSRLYEFMDVNSLKGTLFVSGMAAKTEPDLIAEGALRGHTVGTHGWKHFVETSENFKTSTDTEQREWLGKATDALTKACGTRPRCFRAPYLKICESTLRVLEDLGYKIDSSVPARRFDMWRGEVNSLRYFRASLKPYHLSANHLGRRGNSSILEIAPSASVVPINLAALRILGLDVLKWATRAVSAQSDTLVFYCHPSELSDPDKLMAIPGTSANFRNAMGPTNLSLMSRYVDFVRSCGYRSGHFSEFLQ